MMASVRGGCPGSGGGGVGWMGCRGLARLRRRMVGPGWARPGWAVPGGFLGVKDGLRGAVVVSWRPADGDGGRVRGAQWVSGRLGHARHGNG